LGFIVLSGVVALAVYAVVIYNRLVALRNRYKNSFSQIDVQLKRRYDLIPNLVESVKGIMAHEKSTLESVIAARNQASTASNKVASNPGDRESMKQLANAESVLGASMGKLFALMEAYPDLKASSNMTTLMEELSSTENKVAFARQGYNDSVMAYNTSRESFPAVFFSLGLGFTRAELLEIENPAERQSVKIKF
jgi:LemA protein